jgi:hypothetical protein
MGRPRTVRLREAEPTPALKRAKVIDAQFEVIGKPTIWARIGLTLTALFWAAVIGFAVPQLWMFSQRVGLFLAER